MDVIKFNNLAQLHWLWAVLVLAGIVVYGFVRKRHALERFASAHLVGHLILRVSFSRQRVRASLLLLAMTALVLGMIDPRWGVYYEDIPRRGIDIMFVLDVSRSMLAEDIAPSRLGRAKQYIGDVLEVLGGDRVGLVTFAGAAELKCPLTINYGAYRMTLDEVQPMRAARGGTLIGDAVRLAAASFVDKVKKYKAIIVMTDGEDQESYPVEAAEKAFVEQGIRVYTIGIGDTSEGTRIPVEKEGSRFFLQHDGQEVWSKMNPVTLRDMAVKGGGAYIPAGTRNIDLGRIYRERMASVDRREFDVSRVERYKVQYMWFAGVALLLLIVEACMSDLKQGGTKGLA